LPPREWNRDEIAVYHAFHPDRLQEFIDALTNLKACAVPLSEKSQEILIENSPQRQLELIDEARRVINFKTNINNLVQLLYS
jgi:hypothetical protein